MGIIDRVAAWPSSKSTFALAICMAALSVVNAINGDLDWAFWAPTAIALVLLAVGLRQRRKGD